MKNTRLCRLSLLLSLLVLSLTTSAANEISEILSLTPVKVEKVSLSNHPFVEQLSFSFGQSQLELTDTQWVAGSVIERVDFFYSSYKESSSFAQRELNRKRLEAVNDVLPQAFSNEMTEWRMMVQIEDEDKAKALELFHGVVVYYRPKPTEASTEVELDYLKELLSLASVEMDTSYSEVDESSSIESPSIGKSITSAVVRKTSVLCSRKRNVGSNRVPKFPGDCRALENHIREAYLQCRPRRRKTSGSFECTINSEGKAENFSFRHYGQIRRLSLAMAAVQDMPTWNMPKKGEDSSFVLKVNFTIGRFRKNIKVRLDQAYFEDRSLKIAEGTKTLVASAIVPTVRFLDPTISNFFERNQDIRNAAVVCDVTGSMSPYLGQVLLWHKLNFANNQEKLQYFCFFNDGNNKSDRKKKVGEVGGLYFTQPSTYEEIERMSFRAMRAGCGGDSPENNYEAVAKTLGRYPSCKEVIMIADNWASPRDMVLLEKIDRPIKIILCGVRGGYINTAYLNAVRRNGGSLHTIESDITSLSVMAEGEVIDIDGVKYRLRDGVFERV